MAELSFSLPAFSSPAPIVPPTAPVQPVAAGIAGLPAGGGVGPAFGEVLQDFLGQVDGAQKRADSLVEKLALGEPVDTHQVMIALGEASNAVNLTLQLRNKAVEAYQELMRMQM